MMPMCEGIGCEKVAVFLGPNENPAYCEEHLAKLMDRIGEWVNRSKDPLKPDPNAHYEIENTEIEGVLKDIGGKIGSRLPKGWGFTLAIASYGKDGSTFYISNVERSSAMEMLQELIPKLADHKERLGNAD